MYPINAELSVTIILVEEFYFKTKANQKAFLLAEY